MANTTHCSISAYTVVEGDPVIRVGNLAAQDYAGYAEYFSATKTLTKVDTDTAATLICKPSIVEWKPEVSSTGAHQSADSQLATTAQTPAVTCFKGGIGQIVVAGTDLNAAAFVNTPLMATASGGMFGLAALGHGGAAYDQMLWAWLWLAKDVADDDTYYLARMI